MPGSVRRKRIPAPVVQRLIKYLAHIRWLKEHRTAWVSSQELAEALGLTSSTVRQDLSHVEFSGLSKRGYEIQAMETAIGKVLCADQVHRVVLVGAGNLGKALALHSGFARNGFDICGIYDRDEKLLGRKVGSLVVKSMRDLPGDVGRSQATMGILAVPAPAAQQVADLLIVSGVRGLLNLAPTHIIVPDHVSVVDTRIIGSLQELAYVVNARR